MSACPARKTWIGRQQVIDEGTDRRRLRRVCVGLGVRVLRLVLLLLTPPPRGLVQDALVTRFVLVETQGSLCRGSRIQAPQAGRPDPQTGRSRGRPRDPG